MAREGGATALSTRLPNLVDGVILLKEKTRGNTMGLPSQGGGGKAEVSPIAGGPVLLPYGAEGDSVLRGLLSGVS